MAGLNLTPDPTALGTQAVIFLGAVFVVKKLMVEPYLAVQEKRDRSTVGSKAEAADLQRKNEELIAEIERRYQVAAGEAKDIRNSILKIAVEKKDTILAEASKKASAIVDDVRNRIKADLAEEKSRVPAIVADLSQVVYEKTLN